MEMEVNMENTHPTQDLYESAFLYASGQKLIQLKNDNGRFSFIFEDVQACQRLIDSYWRKDATVNAKEYADAVRSLKDRIFSLQRK